MQTPDSCSAADRTGEASARGHGVGGGSGPSLPVVGMSGKRTAVDSSLPPRGVPCLSTAAGRQLIVAREVGESSLPNGCIWRALAAELSSGLSLRLPQHCLFPGLCNWAIQAATTTQPFGRKETSTPFIRVSTPPLVHHSPIPRLMDSSIYSCIH